MVGQRILRFVFLATALTNLAHGEAFAFPEEKVIDGTPVKLQAEAPFRWLFLKVYTGALYAPSDSTLNNILTPTQPKQLDFVYHVDLEAKAFIKSGIAYLKKNCTPHEIAKIEEDLEALHEQYRNVKKGDRYTLTYVPEKGTTLALNDTPLITITNPKFAELYYQIWLGEKPIKPAFRKALARE